MMSTLARPPAATAPAVPARPWWTRSEAMFGFMLLSTFPLWFTATPPLTDFIGHIARYHVALEIGDNPLLQRNWAYHWALIGNLGVDLLIMPLARLIGLEHAAWLIAAILPPLMISGIFRAARAVHGAVPPTAIAALPFALAYPYQYGFVNFWLAAGLGFHAFALWVRLQGRVALRSALFVPLGFAIWVCHVYGWAIFGVLVGGYELSAALRRRDRGLFRAVATAVARTWPLLTVVVAMVIWRTNGQGAETLGWFRFHWKLVAGLLALRDQYEPLDVGSLIAVVCLLYFGIRDKRARLDPRFGIAAVLLLAALLLLPYQLFGSAFADARVYPFLFIAALLAVRLPGGDTGEGRIAHVVAIGFAALFALRIAVAAFGYAEYDAAFKRHLVALDHVERGASVAVLAGFPCDPGWRMPRVEHLGSMALLRRDAFVNSQWDVPGAELLRARRAVGTGFDVDPSQFVVDARCPRDLRPALARRIAQLPRRDFDYLWVFSFDPRTLPRYDHLTPLYRDDSSILFRVAPPGR